MKKHIVLLCCLPISLALIFLLMNCADTSSSTGPDTQNENTDSSFGFTPGSPTTMDSSVDYMFSSDSAARGGTEISSTRDDDDDDDDDIFHKNSNVLDNEETFGTSAPFTSTNNTTFEDFRLGEPINSMKDIEDLRVYVQLSKTNKNHYAGEVTIAYWDYGRQKPFRRVRFSSGNGDNAKYNVWFRKNDKKYFHGFFQENYGSIILVIDKVTPVVKDPDNPQPDTLYSGSIWTMQFRTTFRGKNSCNNHDQRYVFEHNKYLSGYGQETIPRPNRKCWFITKGPYDCRTWRAGKGVNTLKAVLPDGNCYSKLGTFEGLDILKAFDINEISDLVVR